MAVWFTDARGTEWEVWEVAPRRAPADAAWGAFEASHARAWLCFESATHRRHLARYPAYWASLQPHALAALCETARPQSPFDVEGRALGVGAW
jgi:hypothetical protein